MRFAGPSAKSRPVLVQHNGESDATLNAPRAEQPVQRTTSH
jgi:hypothetical protein